MPRKSNVSKKSKPNLEKVWDMLTDLGVELDEKNKEHWKLTQWVLNTLVEFMVLFMRTEVKEARSVYAVVLWFIKSLLQSWDRFNAGDRSYDELKRGYDQTEDLRLDSKGMESIGRILKDLKKRIGDSQKR